MKKLCYFLQTIYDEQRLLYVKKAKGMEFVIKKILRHQLRRQA